MEYVETQPNAASDAYHNYVLVTGSSLNKLSFIGPFETERAAADFATMECEEVAWRVKLLTHPQAPEFWGV
jgi:hypothetical protein